MSHSRKNAYVVRSSRRGEAIGVGVIVLGAIAGICVGARLAGGGGAAAGAVVGGLLGALVADDVTAITFAIGHRGVVSVRCELR